MSTTRTNAEPCFSDASSESTFSDTLPISLPTSLVPTEEETSFYDLEATDIHGNEFKFEQLRGKLVLITNTATQCASRRQLRQLDELYQRWKDDGLVVVGFPSNQFFQERASSLEDINEVCERKFHVSFPLMEKVRVNGKNQHEVMRWLKDRKKGWLGSTRVKWNFEKFLVGRDGQVLERYSTLQKSNTIDKRIEEIIDQAKRTSLKATIRVVQQPRVIYI